MKIAIATIDKNDNSEISSRAGRTPFFLIFNEKEELLEVVSNPFSVGGGGVGIAVAKMLADKGIDVFVAETLGENIINSLKEKGVKYYEKQGTAKKALQEVIKAQ